MSGLVRPRLGALGSARHVDRLAVLGLLLTAAVYGIAVVWLRAQRRLGYPSNDIYAYFYPNIAYAWQSLRLGNGLLWNRFQDCGQPFFADSQTGLLYPVNAVFFLLGREAALVTSRILNLFIAGAGMFLLCRALALGRIAALSSALVFQLAGTAVQLAAWSPMHIGSYAWLPAAMWATERLARRATVGAVLLLSAVLTMQALPGFPQIQFFTYQLIALRIGWILLTQRTRRPLVLIGAASASLVLPFLLAAVQLLPSLEVARQSVRWGSVFAPELGPDFSWPLFYKSIGDIVSCQGAVVLVLAAVPGICGILSRRQRSAGCFYLAAAVLYFVLSLGRGAWLFDAYEWLPLGSTFRSAPRLVWVANFCLAVSVAFGVEALARARSGWRWAMAGTLGAGAVLLQLLGATGVGTQWALTALAMAVLVTSAYPAMAARVRVGVPVVILGSALVAGCPPFLDLRSGDLYDGAAPAFAFVRERLTAQDRVAIVGTSLSQYSLTPKTASLFHVPSIFDYEPQAALPYAQFFTYMRTGQPMQTLHDWYWVFGDLLPSTLQRRLFDLTASRYLIVDRAVDTTGTALGSGIRLVFEVADVRVYENEQASPRAFYVPRLEVTAPDAILPALARGSVDPRRAALVGEAPRSGFLGASADTSGTVDLAVDDADHMVIRVRADAPGFLFLADEYFPGWTAEVNGDEAEILRANYTFRAVAVPAGASEVVFTYRPSSMRAGAAISLVTLIGMVIAWGWSRRRATEAARSGGTV
jgi:hypothetical protein